MPLAPVPLIIGTTLAVLGSGYAFKKFIYDPHLAPWLDALLAHPSLTWDGPDLEPVHPFAAAEPIAVPAYTTARAGGGAHPLGGAGSDGAAGAQAAHLRHRRRGRAGYVPLPNEPGNERAHDHGEYRYDVEDAPGRAHGHGHAHAHGDRHGRSAPAAPAAPVARDSRSPSAARGSHLAPPPAAPARAPTPASSRSRGSRGAVEARSGRSTPAPEAEYELVSRPPSRVEPALVDVSVPADSQGQGGATTSTPALAGPSLAELEALAAPQPALVGPHDAAPLVSPLAPSRAAPPRRRRSTVTLPSYAEHPRSPPRPRSELGPSTAETASGLPAHALVDHAVLAASDPGRPVVAPQACSPLASLVLLDALARSPPAGPESRFLFNLADADADAEAGRAPSPAPSDYSVVSHSPSSFADAESYTPNRSHSATPPPRMFAFSPAPLDAGLSGAASDAAVPLDPYAAAESVWQVTLVPDHQESTRDEPSSVPPLLRSALSTRTIRPADWDAASAELDFAAAGFSPAAAASPGRATVRSLDSGPVSPASVAAASLAGWSEDEWHIASDAGSEWDALSDPGHGAAI